MIDVPGGPLSFWGGGASVVGGSGRRQAGGIESVTLGTISDLSVDSTGETTATLSWSDVEGATSYQPQYRTAGGGSYSDFGSTIGEGVGTVEITGLTTDQEYDFRVVASDGSSTTNSNVVQGTPAASVSPFFEDDFDSGQFNDADGFTWSGTHNTAVSDDIAFEGTHSLRFTFGPDASGEDSNAEQRFTMGRELTEVWIEYYIYYPDGSEGLGASFAHRNDEGPDNNKFFRLWGGEHGDYSGHRSKVGMSTNHSGGGPDGRIFFEYAADGESGFGTFNGPTSESWEDDRGRWIQVRMYYKLVSTAGADDGHMTLWKDGQVWMDFPNVDQDEEAGQHHMNPGYFMGWANSGFTDETHVYIDSVKFYDTDPGWDD